jgi:F-type H+-transporting ATPase subunit delta
MAETKVALRYAKSLIGLAKEQGSEDAVNKDMELLLKTVHENKLLDAFFRNPIVKTNTKASIVKKIFGESMNKLSLAFMNLVVKKRREAYLPAIANEYINLYKHNKGIETIIITSAIGLDDKLRSEVLNILKKSTDSEIELIEKVDKRLIGGFILRKGDKQYDASIAKNFRELGKELHDNYIRRN